VAAAFPHMGDAGVKKRMERDKNWYPYVTVRSIIQAAGRSIRNDKDHAETYILDACWETFYRQNRLLFPDTFRASVIKS
jgi:Rad3-related DNA helicase